MKALKRKIVIGWLIWSSLFLMAARALQEFGDLEAVLVWVAVGGGAMALVGYLMAYLLENVPAWGNLPRLVKVLFPIAIASLLGFLANSILALDLVAEIPASYQAFLLAAINWVFSQRALMGANKASYGASH